MYHRIVLRRLGLNECSEAKPCPMHSEYKKIKAQFKRLFEDTAIRHLADELEKGEGRLRRIILAE